MVLKNGGGLEHNPVCEDQLRPPSLIFQDETGTKRHTHPPATERQTLSDDVNVEYLEDLLGGQQLGADVRGVPRLEGLALLRDM